MFNRFPYYRQLEEKDCGPTCIKIIGKYYGKEYSVDYLRNKAFTNREGSSLFGVVSAAENVGFEPLPAKVTFEVISNHKNSPFICLWGQNHFVVVYKITSTKVYISDPAYGLVSYSIKNFLKYWISDGDKGIVLFLKPKENFQNINVPLENRKEQYSYALFHFKKYRLEVFYILMTVVTTSIFQLIIPFITQSLVDNGISQRNYQLISLLLIAQLFIFIGRTLSDITRSYLLLHLSSRLSIRLLSDFFIKLTSLPISYFDKKMTGDIMQRINDHSRVETFLTSGILSALFSIINLIVFIVVLGLYSFKILTIFSIGSLIYFIWLISFSRKRAILDSKKFYCLSTTNAKNIELLTGMQEIKLGNAEKQKRWEWEAIQIEQFHINLKSLSLKQIQIDGASIINEFKNILITFIAAKLVIGGDISIGAMLSISVIIGQLNAPILLMTQFLQDFQDSKLSLNRINEIHNMRNEDVELKDLEVNDIPNGESLNLKKVYFKYSLLPNASFVLKDITVTIPARKITAIVGASGSGKTTLMKLLLKFYEPTSGTISYGAYELDKINFPGWRKNCGVVMQEGYIFNNTIANNIALGGEYIDEVRMEEACRIANIVDYILGLPLRYNTIIGSTGLGLSSGQKQRILIARAVYKNPDILFFDEATSALDANNERIIINNLDTFFKGKTVVIVAHRLSTVFSADQILVLENGELIEQGNHSSLIEKKGSYFGLIRNQLELGQ